MNAIKEQTNKRCSECGVLKSVNEFHKGSNGAKYHPKCKSCRSRLSAIHYKDHWFNKFCLGKKSECKQKKLPFDLDPEYLESIWTDTCPIFGVNFEKHNKKSSNCPALDRKKPELGYTRGNVNWICSRANRIKYDATPEELEKILEYVREDTH